MYCYCLNDPVNYCDPLGHFAISTLIILGLIAVGAIVGGTVAGVNSYNNGNTGWELAGDIFVGALIGGIFGYFAAPGIAAMLSSTGTIGDTLVFAGGMGSAGAGIAISFVGQLALAGSIVSIGALSAIASTIMFYDGRCPGDDPTKAPDGFEWRGNGKPGSSQGNWYNPSTGEILHPDLNHPQPIGPHWDFRDILRQWWRIFKNGKFPK
ncbi:MAG: polymorphic toxin type 37 domain-containing protein [Prevotella sp.]|nr:polymorphic toxin type 37 domain-containing protein [Staphylococcus sp.]MCM1350695.1 polymorphic toxin type 37 domain-containing protein [Prevotella sp.]